MSQVFQLWKRTRSGYVSVIQTLSEVGTQFGTHDPIPPLITALPKRNVHSWIHPSAEFDRNSENCRIVWGWHNVSIRGSLRQSYALPVTRDAGTLVLRVTVTKCQRGDTQGPTPCLVRVSLCWGIAWPSTLDKGFGGGCNLMYVCGFRLANGALTDWTSSPSIFPVVNMELWYLHWKEMCLGRVIIRGEDLLSCELQCSFWPLTPLQLGLASEWTSNIHWNNVSSKSFQEPGLHTLVLTLRESLFFFFNFY